MEWFTVLSELGKGLLGAETAKKQGEINALLQLFGIEGEVQRRKILEEEMALKKEAHELQKKLTEAEIGMLPTRKEMLEAQTKLMKTQADEATETLPLRRQLLETDVERARLQMQRAKFEDLYDRGITPDDVFNDDDYKDEFKEAYKRYYLTRQFRERLPLIKSEEDIGDLIAMFPEEARDQMMAIAQFYLRENQIKDYLAQLQMDTAELQKFDTSRKIAYDTVFNIINRTPKWDTMKTEERMKLLREAIDKSNLPPALQNFFTEDALKVFAGMSSETAELVRRAQLIGGVEFGYQRRMEQERRATALASIAAQGRQERQTLEMKENYDLVNQAFKQAGGGQGGGQPTPTYPLRSYTNFLKKGNSINQYGVSLHKTALDKYMQETADYNNLPINIGNNQTIPFSVIKQDAYNSIVGLSEPTFAVNPNAQRAQQYFANLMRFRYIELQLSGLDPNTAFNKAFADVEEFVYTINSPQIKALWEQYKQSARK